MAHVAQIVDCFAYGTSKSVMQLCDQLRGDHRFTLYYGQRQGTGVDLPEIPPHVTAVPLPGRGPARHLSNLRFLRQQLTNVFDVVHGHSAHGGMYAKLLGPTAGLRTFYSPRGYSFLRQDLPGVVRAGCRIAERWTARRAVTIGCGPHEASLARSLGGSVLQINNASARRGGLPIDQTDGTILGVGRVCMQKGFDRFVDVARHLPEHRFVWIGQAPTDSPPEFSDLPPNVEQIDYAPHREVLDRIDRCRFVLLPSRWEGLSRFLIEAVCAGKPIVTSRFAGNLDCLAPNDDSILTGWYDNGFASDDVAELTTAVRRLASDDAAAQSAGDASLTLAAGEFDLDRIRDRWSALYAGEPSVCHS